ncbi:MAG: PTS transporter subunit EIIC [Eubacteriales bacterium]|nr:PTS transporter subunit EIIC [Eubacteriales bacterium]
MSEVKLAQELLNLVGGKENVRQASHCMTRLRVDLFDRSKVNIDGIKAAGGVLGVVDDETLQIVLGPGKARKVCEDFAALAAIDMPVEDLSGQVREEIKGSDGKSRAKLGHWQETKAELKAGQKDNFLKRGLRTIANIFIPMIPAVIAAGLFFGLSSLVAQLCPRQFEIKAGLGYVLTVLFQLFGSSFLGYFAIFTGVSAAQQFGATPAMGGMIGAMSLGGQIIALSTWLGLYNVDEPLKSILTTGKGGIIGVIIGVWILAKVEKFFRKRIPDVLDLILTPLFTIFITGTIFVFAIMPLAGLISDGLVFVLSLLINSANPVISVISGYVLSAVFLPMVLLGLHHGLIPIYAVQLEQMGGVSLFPVLAMAGAGQVGAAIAIYLKAAKSRNLSLKKIILGALPAGLLGVGEPLIYGVTLPLGKPFITAGLGAGFGGAFVMLMGVKAIAWGPSGLVAIPLMKTPAMMLYYFLGLLIAYTGGFIITSLFIKEDDIAKIK